MNDIQQIDLGAAPRFRVGSLEVRPAQRQVVTAAGAAITIEPRVMQVLAVLAGSGGQVVSRDELTRRCWNGVVVGDGAIHRVISLIRTLASDAGEDSFSIETIPRVGYRLVEAPALEHATAPDAAVYLAAAPQPSGWIARRGLVAGFATAAVAAAVAAGLSVTRSRPGPAGSPADDLAERGQFSMRLQGERSAGQSVRYLEKAAEVDPKSPRAWGGLALAYSLAMIQADDSDLQSLAARCEAAAARALDLQPDNANARIALAIYPGPYRRWAAMQDDLDSVLGMVGAHPMPIAALADVLSQTGRWRDALQQWDRSIATDALIPVSHAQRGRTLWSLGRLLEAEQELDDAARTLPPHPGVLHAMFDLKLFSGRPEEAKRAIDDSPAIAGALPLPRDIALQLVALVGSGDAGLASTVAQNLIAACARRTLRTNVAGRYLAAIGEIEAAFGLFASYYFGGSLPSGQRLPAPARYARRRTDELFFPTAAGLRASPAFAPLTARLGLDAYWRQTGTRPQLPAAVGARRK